MPRLRDGLQLAASALIAGGMFFLPLAATMVGQTHVEYDLLPEPTPRIAFTMPAPEPEPAPSPEPKSRSGESSKSDAQPLQTNDKTATPQRTSTPKVSSKRLRTLASTRVPGRAKRRSRSQRKPRKQQKCVAKTPGITEQSSAAFHVERELMKHYSSHLGQAAKLAAVRWHKTADGQVDGFRIGGVRCGSVLHQMGLRSGDVIHTINRNRIENIPQALSAFQRLKKKDTFRVRFTRRGQLKQLKYSVS